MKKQNYIKPLLILLFVVVTQNIQAQFKASVGVEAALLRGSEVSSKGLGVSFGGEFSAVQKVGIIGQLGYVFLLPEESSSGSYMVPLQGGVKVYLKSNEKGVYLQGLLGVHIISMKSGSITDLHFSSKEQNSTVARYSQSFGLGYVANEKVDVVFRWNSISNEIGSSGYVGFRLAYTFQ